MGSLAPEPAILTTYPSPAIIKITLNRPRSLNALNISLLTALVNTLHLARTERRRIIILEGAGDRSFCAGEDLKETLAPATGTAEELRVAFNLLQDITRLTSSSESLVIAAVQGFAIGGGAEIALAADFVIGGPGAKFRFPEVPIGHAATGGITLRLTHMVGLLKAKELLIRGRFIPAEEAFAIGLMSELVEDPKSRAIELARELESLPTISAMSSKAGLERAVFPNMEVSLADEVNVASYCFAQSDAAKAFENFAKRNRTSNGNTKHTPESASASPQPGPECSVSTTSEAHKGPVPASTATTDYLRSVRDINTAFDNAVKSFGARSFLKFGGKTYSFEDIDNRVSELAGGLAYLGITTGDRVLVMMRNNIDMVNLWLATNRLGATWVPINVELKSITLQHVVHAAEAKIAIVDAEFVQGLEAAEIQCDYRLFIRGNHDPKTDLETLYTLGPPVKSATPVAASSSAAFLYTSGTTGKSKPCVLSHQYFILQASALIETFGLHQDDVLYCPFPLFHADATALTVIPAILLGATAALSVRFSASRFWDEVREADATVYDFMGATLALTYKQAPTSRDRDHHVRLAWGVPIPKFAEDYEQRFGHPLYTLYGSVEASLPVMQQGPRVLGSCGRVRPGYHLRIADENDDSLPPNTPGHLLLRSDVSNAFFQGYFNNPHATVTAYSNLWLHTGDLARIDEDGNVYFVGRVKDVIRRRGENVNAAEIEEEFLRHEDVVVAAAFAIPSDLGEGTEDEVKVAVKLRENSLAQEADLFDWAVQHMARFQVPSVIEIVSGLKRTPTGKLEKSWLGAEGGKKFEIRNRPSKETY
ncbi:putative coenzyme A synthetase [Exophiala viscosa]|uniref:Coenzyme A synthetase n=1 Tax=Exophiala viscosa TaxID=2486360 RepID=A0AAN6IGR6_9EURO|nr:putative coenzyme A synthetase [Exophiala viscosa]